MSFSHPAGAAAAMITAGGPGGGGGEGDRDCVEGVIGVVDLINEDLDADPTTGGGDGSAISCFDCSCDLILIYWGVWSRGILWFSVFDV